VPPFQIAEAASGLCELLWLVDESVPEDASTRRLLRKVGTVVNTAGLSPEETVSVLRAHSPDGVVGYRDRDVLLLSFVAAELGLDYHTPEVARRLVDKLCQREALRSAGLPTPLCWEVPPDRSPAAVEALAAAVEFPAVLKPRTASGSKYATPVADASDLVRQVATLPPQAGGETGMFVEQYLPGPAMRLDERFADYVSVESLVAHGEISHLATNGRFPLAEPFRETGTFIPADLAQAQQATVLEVATAALRALGVRTGGFHTEIKLTPSGPRVIEVNGRLGGGVPEMLFQASGVSLLRLSIRVALGEPVVVDGPIMCARVGWRLMFQPPMRARRVVSIEGLDRLAERPGVSSVFLNRAPGDPVDWREGTGHYIYEATGVSADYDALLEINRFLHEEVSIVYG
jgi:biotin carboxylase